MKLSEHPVMAVVVGIVLIVAISLAYGVSKEDKMLVELKKENEVLKRRIATLEGQLGKPEMNKMEVNDEILALGRKLKSSPGEFLGRQIKLCARFGGLNDKYLDDPRGPKFSSTYNIEFIAWNGTEIDEPIFDRLFISKKEAKEQGVYQLNTNDFVTVYGLVSSAYDNEAWIEVYRVRKGWE